MYAFRLAYDGRGYHGFQRQPHVDTIEDQLFDALTALDILQSPDERPSGYTAAGRTDAGVSARAQTVAFDCPQWLDPDALNSALPADIWAWAVADVPETFHATRDATTRVYRHYLHAPTADVDRAETVVDRLSGYHDFHNLTPAETGTERDLDATVTRDGSFLVLVIESTGFVHELVRRIAGLVRRVATGGADMSFVDRVLASEPLAGPEGIAPEPGDALLLVDVTYPSTSFEVTDTAAEQTRTHFHDQASRAATRNRVLDAIATEIED